MAKTEELVTSDVLLERVRERRNRCATAVPDDVGLQLLENAVATGAALAALIVALQPVSSAFNPVITALERLAGVITGRQALTIVAAQIIGGMVGVASEPDVRRAPG